MRRPGRALDETSRPLAEINMTPLVDVTLVLLIVFMITAPLMKQGFKIELPKASPQQFDIESEQTLVLTITKDGVFALNGAAVQEEQLPLALDEAARNRADKTLYLEADQETAYGIVIRVLDAARQVGLRISLIYEPKNLRK
jgi:biopolymer transport protein ExbD